MEALWQRAAWQPASCGGSIHTVDDGDGPEVEAAVCWRAPWPSLHRDQQQQKNMWTWAEPVLPM